MVNKNDTQQWWKRQVTVPLLAIIVSIAITALIILYTEFDEQRGIFSFSIIALATGAGIVSAYYIGRGLKESAKAEEFNRTFAFTTRWGDPALRPARDALREVVDEYRSQPRVDATPETIMQRINEDAEVRRSVISCLNLLEEMALAVHQGVVHEETLRRYYRGTVTRAWETLKPWIESDPRRRGGQIFIELENLYNSWAAN